MLNWFQLAELCVHGFIRKNTGLWSIYLLCFIFLGSLQGIEIPLPDTIRFKPGVPLPYYAKTQELACFVIEKREYEIVITTAKYSGIKEEHVISRELIESIEHGKPGIRDFALIEGLLDPPKNSQPTEFYEFLINRQLRPFLEKYPDFEQAPQVTLAIEVLELELSNIRKGKIKAEGTWYTPEELKAALPDIQAMQWSANAERAYNRGDITRFQDLLKRLASLKTSRKYPDLVETSIEWIPIFMGRLNPDSYREKLEQELAWIRTQTVQLGVAKEYLEHRDAPEYFNPSSERAEFFFNPQTRFWHRFSESEMDEDTGEIVRILSESDTKRIQEIDQESRDLSGRRQRVTESLDDVEKSMELQTQFFSKTLKELKEIDLASLRTLIPAAENAVNTLRTQPLFTSEVSQDSAFPANAPKLLAEHQNSLDQMKKENEEALKVWPEFLLLKSIKKALENLDPIGELLKKRQWLAILNYTIENPDPISRSWLNLRKTDIQTLLPAIEQTVDRAARALTSENLGQFLPLAQTVLSLDQTGKSGKRITQITDTYFYGKLKAGEVKQAKSFLATVGSLSYDPNQIETWSEEFSWVNLWGYRNHLHQFSTMGFYSIIAVAFVLLLGMTLSIYLIFRKYLLKFIFRRSW
ncbi:MAG: hypothetical protein AAF558_10115 [Verrucomicrobiota bacterium]